MTVHGGATEFAGRPSPRPKAPTVTRVGDGGPSGAPLLPCTGGLAEARTSDGTMFGESGSACRLSSAVLRGAVDLLETETSATDRSGHRSQR